MSPFVQRGVIIIIVGHRDHDRTVVRFTFTYGISAHHHHYSCEFDSRPWGGVLDTP